MKKISRVLIVIVALVCTIKPTFAFFNTNTITNSNFDTKDYNIYLDANGGGFGNENVIIKNNQTNLPSPYRNGYQFLGYSTVQNGSVAYSTAINNVENINNKQIYACWNVKYYSISYDMNGGYLANSKTNYNVEESFSLSIPTRDGYTFSGWTGSNGTTPQNNVSVAKGTTGNLTYTANWKIKTFTLDINPIIQNVTYKDGLNGFTFSVWINGNQVADRVVDYYNSEIGYGSTVRVLVYDRDGYNIKSFRDNTWTVSSNLIISPSWYDDIPPVITSFSVVNLGYLDPSVGSKKGWRVNISINGYDNGTGIQKYQTWLVPYGNGAGAPRVDGSFRQLEGVLYLEEPTGRTFCAYAIDNAGNEASKCETIKV